jgi:subtilisin family serine protease
MGTFKMFFVLWLTGSLVVPFVSGMEEGGNPGLYKEYRGLEEFGVEDAWKMGYTGKGVKVAIIDSGIDFATPDLVGTQARVSDPASPYDGWPIVIDLDSLSSYQQGVFSAGSQYADTASTDVESYHVTGTSKSGIYHIGDHPDSHHVAFYGQPVKVLLVDEKTSGIYDTVYVDLNNNHDFRDDKPCQKGDEISYWDRDDDGYPDESGGMIYFIADGKTPLPLSEMLYGKMAKIPGNGELVAFHIDPYTHGTMCASVIASQGKNVKGVAPDAKLIPVRAYGSNDMIFCLLASLGYDGIPGTGDEANIISASRSVLYFEKGADEISAFLDYLTKTVAPSTTIVYGNGNEGSGYGTCGSPCSEYVINVGAIYDLWWNGSSYRGDVTCFSSRGPNALGQVKPNVLATGYWAPRVEPLWSTHSGRGAWSRYCGGTSGATPHVSAVVALIYQAYRDKYGEFPSSEKARNILMSSATNIDEEIFAQGAGIINARRAVEMASGKGGLLIEPALLVTPPAEAGSELEFNFTVNNYSGKNFILKPQKLVKKEKEEFVMESDQKTFLSIPKELLDDDLLKVSFYYPRDARNTKVCVVDGELCEGYDLILYNWKDVNGDGKFASDESIPNEAQKSELEPIAIGAWGSVFTSEVRMHHPADRSDEGIVAGLIRKNTTYGDEIHMVVETYSWNSWDIEIYVEKNQYHCIIPVPDATGVYQGRILMEYGEEEQCIPMSFAVYRKDDIMIANDQDIYENDKIYGRFEGDGKGIYDSRFYPIYHYGHDLATIEVTWEDPKTDIDVYLYGEGMKNFSSLWEYSTIPPIELPVLPVLKENAHSTRTWRTRIDQYVSGSGLGASYSTCYTSTGENKEVIIGELTKGLNTLILNQVVPGGEMYGENITIQMKVAPLTPSLDIRTKVGDVFGLQLAGADGVVGFSSGEYIAEGKSKIFEAKKSDVILLHTNCTNYSPHLFFDENDNGMFDGDVDEVVFAESRFDIINPFYTDIIPISRNGTYILVDFVGEFYHMTDRYELNDSLITEIEAHEKAGVYSGIAEKDGNLLPVRINLVVEHGEPASLHMSSVDRIGCNLPFDVNFKVYDAYGNVVADNTTATVEFDNTTNSVRIVNGVGLITLTAPAKTGAYRIKLNSTYGFAEKVFEVTDEAIIEIGEITIGDKEVALTMTNSGGSCIELDVYANPSIHLDFDPDMLPMAPSGMYQSMFSHSRYLSRSGNSTFSICGGEERDIVIATSDAVSFGEPYIIVATSAAGDVITYEEINNSPSLPAENEEIRELKDTEIAFANQPLSFKVEGLISVQLNEHQPLFFVTHGAFSIYPDEVGELGVTTDVGDYMIAVVAIDGKVSDGVPAPLKNDAANKVGPIVINSTDGNICISWMPIRGADHYNVYQIESNRLKLLEVVEDPEYSMEGDLWNSYTFRVSSVDEAGNEGLLSDPVGSVAIP